MTTCAHCRRDVTEPGLWLVPTTPPGLWLDACSPECAARAYYAAVEANVHHGNGCDRTLRLTRGFTPELARKETT